jgi:hypothetical protein
MRRIWLWVLLYAIVVGFGLVLGGVGMAMGSAMGTVSNPDTIIGIFPAFVCILATIVGFLALIAGMIFLLIRRTVAAGRVVPLIGLGFYYVAALGLILSALIAIPWSPPWEIVVLILAVAVPVGLPGFFITRTLLRAIKAERSEN